jgi:hypothetical protein
MKMSASAFRTGGGLNFDVFWGEARKQKRHLSGNYLNGSIERLPIVGAGVPAGPLDCQKLGRLLLTYSVVLFS